MLARRIFVICGKPITKTCLKGNAAYLKKKFIMDENDTLSEYNEIPLGYNRTNGAVTPKSTSKLRFAQHIRYSKVIPRFIPRANTAQT